MYINHYLCLKFRHFQVDDSKFPGAIKAFIFFLLVEVANGELWAASDDKIESNAFETDNFSDGDTIDDCEFRNEMRKMR